MRRSRPIKLYFFFPGREPNFTVCKCNWIQGYTNFGRIVRPGATESFAVAPGICRSSIWTVLRVVLHASRILKWLLDICKNRAVLASVLTLFLYSENKTKLKFLASSAIFAVKCVPLVAAPYLDFWRRYQANSDKMLPRCWSLSLSLW